MWQRENGVHAEPDIRLTGGAYSWNFPDPLPVPLPPDMAVEVVAAELLGIRNDLLLAAQSVGCRLESIEKTLRDVTNGRVG